MHKLALLAAVVIFILHAVGVDVGIDVGLACLAGGVLLSEVDLDHYC